jgi:hypothetical protein
MKCDSLLLALAAVLAFVGVSRADQYPSTYACYKYYYMGCSNMPCYPADGQCNDQINGLTNYNRIYTSGSPAGMCVEWSATDGCSTGPLILTCTYTYFNVDGEDDCDGTNILICKRFGFTDGC